jgi:hypothetical protein
MIVAAAASVLAWRSVFIIGVPSPKNFLAAWLRWPDLA